MHKRVLIPMCFGTLFIVGTYGAAQTLNRPPAASMDPCPGGVAKGGVLETERMISLEMLVSASGVIVVGKVVEVLPAVLRSADRPNATQTDSLVVITERLYGKLPPTTSTLALTQIGGKVGRCEEVIQDDPLVKVNESYVLFLWSDKRTTPANTSGSPRYAAVGIWSGKAKIVNGKIQFLPAARPGLHRYDNMEVTAFTDLVKDRIKKLLSKTSG